MNKEYFQNLENKVKELQNEVDRLKMVILNSIESNGHFRLSRDDEGFLYERINPENE